MTPSIESLPELIQTAYEAEVYSPHFDGIRQRETRYVPFNPADAPFWAVWYAYNVLKSRWIEAEPTIITSPQWACKYAQLVLNSRWPEAEPTIFTDPYHADLYKIIFKLELNTAPATPPSPLLTEAETKLLTLIAEVYNQFSSLPKEHQDEMSDVVTHVHALQLRVMARPTRRNHPNLFNLRG